MEYKASIMYNCSGTRDSYLTLESRGKSELL